jgi:hypothetical protein
VTDRDPTEGGATEEGHECEPVCEPNISRYCHWAQLKVTLSSLVSRDGRLGGTFCLHATHVPRYTVHLEERGGEVGIAQSV